MPVLNVSFSERNPLILGLLGMMVIALITVGSLSAAGLRSALTETSYRARFAEAAGLREGDDVRVSGLKVGQVKNLDIVDNQVEVEFSLDAGVDLGDDTRAEIKSATVLGRKFMSVVPSGRGRTEEDTVIPLERTNTPYDVQSQLEGLAGEVRPLDKEQLAAALDTVSATLEETPEETRAVLQGIRRAAAVVNGRDEALLALLDSASNVTGLLAKRSGDVTALVRQSNLLLDELIVRREAIHAVLVNVRSLLGQLRAMASENNRTIGPALAELNQVSELLKRNRANVTATIEGLRNYTGSLGEAVNGGPWFYGYIANLVPSNMAQQTLDSVLAQKPTTSGGQTP